MPVDTTLLKLYVRCNKCHKLMKNKGYSHECEVGDDDLSGWFIECPTCKNTVTISLGEL